MTPTHKHVIRAAAILLFTCLLIGGAAAAAISVDTEGLVGKTTDTTLVPVVISGAHDVVAWQLSVKTQDDENAKIAIYADSVRKAGAVSGEKVVYWFDATDDRNRHIDGEKTLFYLAVTPQVMSPVSLELYDVYVYETLSSNEVPYQTINGTLIVDGVGSGITIGDSESGATIRYGITDANGDYIPGDKTGIIRVDLPDAYNGTAVTIFTGSAGIYDVPETLGYFSVDELYTETPAGTEYAIVFGVKESDLAEIGVTAENLFVLHCINGKWYQSPITSVETVNGIVRVTIQTWSSGVFVLAYDNGGVHYPTETHTTAISGGTGTGIDSLMLIIGAAVIAGIVVIGIFIVLIRRRKERETDNS